MGAWRRTALVLAWCVLGCACAELGGGGGGGGSLRGALEALQRRQRARTEERRAELAYRPPSDYDEPLFELYGPPPQYDDEQFGVDLNTIDASIPQKYVVKIIDEAPLPKKYFEKMKKKNSQPDHGAQKAPPSAFRERTHDGHSEDKLKELFMERAEEKREKSEEQIENDAEYAMLLEKLWSKYKSNHPNTVEPQPEGVVKLYKEKTVKKRQYPDELSPSFWGPVAFKRKRSPVEENEQLESDDYPSALEYPFGADDRFKYSHNADDDDVDSGYDHYELSPESDNDMREEYIMAFQPLDGETVNLPNDGNVLSYDKVEKRFPVSKRSSGPYESVPQNKRSADSKHGAIKTFRAGAGTDPKVIQELSKIFGNTDVEQWKSLVKRSNKNEENSHETKSPIISAAPHNSTHDHNMTHIHSDGSHEHQGHSSLHPPNLSGKEDIIETNSQSTGKDHSITIKKKSIDWSQYFGVDKRKKKSIPSDNQIIEGLKRQYLITLNREINNPVDNTISHPDDKVKRDFIINKPLDESEFVIDRASAIAIRSGVKRSDEQHDVSKLDTIDRKLKGVEEVMVDEALHLSNIAGNVDSKEEQQVKEKTLSRLAAAYSLEKMRKALKDFKQTLQHSKDTTKLKPTDNLEETKKKRIAVKKEKAELKQGEVMVLKDKEPNTRVIDEFEGEQGAGHYINGGIDESFSEGYMGGSGRHYAPSKRAGLGGGDGGGSGRCPVLEHIEQRCRGVKLLAGDPGLLFLPLCTLHQACHLCHQTAPVTCDLTFLAEADTACGRDGECLQASRAVLMALRELHDTLSDELDGECEAQTCLDATLRLHRDWFDSLRR